MEHWQAALDRYLTSDPREDAEPVYECDMCGGDIYEGETIYKIGKEIYCESCIDDCKCEAERDTEGF